MTTNNDTKLKILLDGHKYGAVYLAPYLEKKGISRDLQQYYCKSGWLESVGRGAFKRPNETVSWRDGLQALVEQANINVHVGGLTALSQQGLGHYVRLGKEKIWLFSPLNTSLPAWFNNHDWAVEVEHVKTDFLPHLELTSRMISEPERAILECLYLAPKRQGILECYYVMEGLVNLRPKRVQKMLEVCTSVKVKRLFLYMAEKANHQWLQHVDLSKITLGKGDRSITQNGLYIGKYKITIPTELVSL